jgi:hypothetical protein
MLVQVPVDVIVAVWFAQVVPFVDVQVRNELDPETLSSATNVPLPYAIDFQAADNDIVDAVQLNPSSEYAALVLPLATATNLVPENATPYQTAALGIVLAVQVVPSGDVAHPATPVPIATPNPKPYANPVHAIALGKVLAVHDTASGDD